MFSIDLKNKTVLITGVTSGIGRGIAKQMALAGANISGCANSADDAGWYNEMTSVGAAALYTPCDVTTPAGLENLVAKTVQRFGRIDIVVSNAGGNVFTGAAESTEADWERNLQLNLASHWHLSKLTKPYLEKNGGVIIVVTSNHAYSSIPGCFPYNIAKTALTGLVRSLAIEWAPSIRTVGIAPGFIDTPGNQQWFDSFNNPAEERQRTINMHPVKKLGTVDEIGGWCVFLASKYAAFASGTTYIIDGGRSALMQDS